MVAKCGCVGACIGGRCGLGKVLFPTAAAATLSIFSFTDWKIRVFVFAWVCVEGIKCCVLVFCPVLRGNINLTVV